MAVLRKIKASSLIETLVATVIIIVIFMISSLIVNNIMERQFSRPTEALGAHLSELEYSFRNGLIGLPYQDSYRDWTITILEEENTMELVAKHKTGKDIIHRTLHGN